LAASVATAQDSVTPPAAPGVSGLPGDALSPYATSQQVARFAVDLTPKSGSLGTPFVIGPAIKASRSIAGGYFDQLIGAQSASARFRPIAAPYSAGAYSVWTTPGPGVNATFNTAPASSLSGLFGQGFGLGFMEFGAGPDAVFSTADDENAVVGGMIHFTYRNPNRLLVSRTVAAVSKGSSTANSTASFGLGSVDESGFMHLYADDYSSVSPSRLTQRNAFRVNQLTRTATSLNNIFQAGSSPASGDPAATAFVRTQVASMVVPAMIARSASGTLNRPVLLTTDLASNLIIETQPAATVVPASGYLPAGSSGPRGSLAFIPQAFAPANASGSALGTAATLHRTDANTRTRGISVFGITSSLGVDSRLALELPTVNASITDPTDAFSPGASMGPLSAHEFTNYASQASFRGSSSQVAMTVLPGGDLLVAALVAASGGGTAVPQSQDNYLAVARVPAAGGPASWSVAAYAGQTTSGPIVGKPIVGRATPGGPIAPIGRLARFTEAFGSASTGPSISSPAMDRLGNLYFTATIALDNPASGQTFSTGLIKAVRDPGTGGYSLELIARVGDVVAGANSGLNYQIQFLGVADADSVDSGAIFSTNLVQDFVAGVAPASITPERATALGALAVRAKLVYDANNDGSYIDPSGAGSGSTSPDQAYNAVLIVMPRILPADFNRDGSVNIDDIFIFLNAWFAAGPGSDWNADGNGNIDDIFIFLNDWFAA
jgi:hypothetical protein